jgi:TonB family protein
MWNALALAALLVACSNKDAPPAPAPAPAAAEAPKVAAVADAAVAAAIDAADIAAAPQKSAEDIAEQIVDNQSAAFGKFDGMVADGAATEINGVMKAKARALRTCYAKQLAKSPDIEGKVVVSIKIGTDGAVKSAKVLPASTLKNDAVETCLIMAIMDFKFPPRDTPSTVNYPFVFRRGG